MKILLTGGGTGGHFYPIIAVAQAIRKVAAETKLIDVRLYYMAPQPYDRQLLFDTRMTFVHNSAGKFRRYFSLANFFDLFRTGWGLLTALWSLYFIFPDIVFGKGGYVSFPVLWAARFLGIPVIIHESDSVPGRMNRWAGRFATRVAVSYPEATKFFSVDKVAVTGNPIRQELLYPVHDGAREFLSLAPALPVILVLGGSQGALRINEYIINALPQLVEKYQIIHQTGIVHFQKTKGLASVVLGGSAHKDRYKPFADFDVLALRMAAGVADIVITRAGSTLFEIAAWGLPAIIIPITDSNGDHQRQNAYNYARTGAAIVIEENNLSTNILVSEVNKLMSQPAERETMKKAATDFARTDAAELIAKEIIGLALAHEK